MTVYDTQESMIHNNSGARINGCSERAEYTINR